VNLKALTAMAFENLYREYSSQTNNVLKRVLLYIIIMMGWQNIFAQDSTHTATKQEVWPEINLFYKINDKVRLFALYSTTKLENSEYSDGACAAYVDYFAMPWFTEQILSKLQFDSTPGTFLWFRAGYSYSSTPGGSENPVTEHTIVTEMNPRFSLPFNIMLTGRNRFDWRYRNGDFMPRYRPKLNFERNMHTAYLTFAPYVYGEYFWDFNNSDVNKFRICGGVELRVTRILNFEWYYNHQFGTKRGVNALDAIGLVLKVYLTHAGMKHPFPKKKKDVE
jgi:hypothetical protein